MAKEKKSKKGILLGAIASVVVIGAVAGASDNDDNSNKPISGATTGNNPETEISVSIEEQTLWEVDGVIITAKGLSHDSILGTQIDVFVENKSDKDVGISATAVIVNDYMISDLTSIKVTAGNKSNDHISLSSNELDAAGIENISEIELYLHTFNPETYMTEKESDKIVIKTNIAEKDNKTSIEGELLFESNGVKITGQYVDEESFWGSAVVLHIENNSDKNVIVQCDEVAVNGFMVSALMSDTVYAGKKCISDITLFESDLEENGITDITEIQTSFKILDENYSTIAESEEVNIKF